MFLSDKMDQDTDSTSEQLDRDNELYESELDTTSDDNDWCPVTKRRRRSDSVPENTSDLANPIHHQNMLVIQNLNLQENEDPLVRLRDVEGSRNISSIMLRSTIFLAYFGITHGKVSITCLITTG